MYYLPSNISRDNRVSIVAVATLLLLLVSAIPFSMAAAITVTTDKTSYQTGDLITVSGDAPPGDSVDISVILSSYDNSPNKVWYSFHVYPSKGDKYFDIYQKFFVVLIINMVWLQK